jgi:hypothetical protein
MIEYILGGIILLLILVSWNIILTKKVITKQDESIQDNLNNLSDEDIEKLTKQLMALQKLKPEKESDDNDDSNNDDSNNDDDNNDDNQNNDDDNNDDNNDDDNNDNNQNNDDKTEGFRNVKKIIKPFYV